MRKHKSLLQMILIIMISGFLGGLAARMLSNLDTYTLGQAMSNSMIAFSPHLLAVSVIGLLAVAIFYYCKAKRLYTKRGIDDEQIFDAVEHKLTIVMMLCALIFVAAFLFYGIFVAGIGQFDSSDETALLYVIFTLLVFIGGTFGSLYLQTRAIHMTKLLYPNKKGDPLEFKFRQDWLNSCDEAEQYIIFRSAYAAYQAVQICILFFWLIAVFGALFFGTGILPIIAVTVLWGVLIMSYTINTKKLEKTRLR